VRIATNSGRDESELDEYNSAGRSVLSAMLGYSILLSADGQTWFSLVAM
jgi:hypothetical protein